MFNKAVATLGILADFVSLISDLSLAWKGQVNATNAQQLGMTVADVESARTAFGIAFGSIRIIREFGAQLLAYLGSGKINNAGLLQLSTSWSIFRSLFTSSNPILSFIYSHHPLHMRIKYLNQLILGD